MRKRPSSRTHNLLFGADLQCAFYDCYYTTSHKNVKKKQRQEERIVEKNWLTRCNDHDDLKTCARNTFLQRARSDARYRVSEGNKLLDCVSNTRFESSKFKFHDCRARGSGVSSREFAVIYLINYTYIPSRTTRRFDSGRVNFIAIVVVTQRMANHYPPRSFTQFL